MPTTGALLEEIVMLRAMPIAADARDQAWGGTSPPAVVFT